MEYDRPMKLVGACPDGSGFFSVRIPRNTPDGTYRIPEEEILVRDRTGQHVRWHELYDTPGSLQQTPGVKVVIRTASGWTLWRYLFVILGTVFRPGSSRVRNLILVGPGISRLTGVPGTRRLRDWAINRGVALSGCEDSPPCRCSQCIARRAQQ